MSTGGDNIRSDYVYQETFDHILAALMPMNRLALEVSLATGLRIDDVLHLKREQVNRGRFTIKEKKTGKSRRITLSKNMQKVLLMHGGEIYIFEGRNDPKKPRTRQAVNKDLKRACKLFRVKGVNITPHTARKIYAVGWFKRSCSLDKVKQLLNHSDEAVTMIYAMADELTAKNTNGKSVCVPKSNI